MRKPLKKTESQVIKSVTNLLEKDGRYFANIKGDASSGEQGKPDFFTLDKEGRFVGLEPKSSIGKAYPNQIRRGKEIIQSGGRYIVAFPDFDLKKLDNYEIPTLVYTNEDLKQPKETFEMIMKERD